MWVPGLPGCASQGETEDQALENIKDAIEGYLAALADLQAESGSETRNVLVNVD